MSESHFSDFGVPIHSTKELFLQENVMLWSVGPKATDAPLSPDSGAKNNGGPLRPIKKKVALHNERIRSNTN